MAKWRLVSEKQKGVYRWVLRRGNYRLPTSQYPEGNRDDEVKLKEWVRRENHKLDEETRAKKAAALKHAYINDELLAEFEAWRKRRTRDSARIPTEMLYLREYVLQFFVGQLNLPAPRNWRLEAHQDAWWDFLRKTKALAPATCRDIIGAANRFIDWLRERRGTAEIPEFKLSPVSRLVYEAEAEDWRVEHEDSARVSIPDADWEKIRQALRGSPIRAHIMLSYSFGLRRGELVGLKPFDVTDFGLSVSRSLKTVPRDEEAKFKSTKGRRSRTVPYWYATQKATQAWVDVAVANRMDPDTLSKHWIKIIEGLLEHKDKKARIRRGYGLHCLRHTFCTRAANAYPLIKVQRAAGHRDIRTTMKYVHDLDKAA